MKQLLIRHVLVLLGIPLVGLGPTFAQRDSAPAHPFLVSELPCPDPHVVTDGSDWDLVVRF
jgi:hypothetical protein